MGRGRPYAAGGVRAAATVRSDSALEEVEIKAWFFIARDAKTTHVQVISLDDTPHGFGVSAIGQSALVHRRAGWLLAQRTSFGLRAHHQFHWLANAGLLAWVQSNDALAIFR